MTSFSALAMTFRMMSSTLPIMPMLLTMIFVGRMVELYSSFTPPPMTSISSASETEEERNVLGSILRRGEGGAAGGGESGGGRG